MKTLRLDSKGAVLTVRLHRPDARNAFNPELIAELTQVFSELDSVVRCVVLTGDGAAFCAGADLHWMKQSAALSENANLADAQSLVGLFEAVNNAKAVVIGWVNGLALGGGAGLVACCDMVLADAKARLGFTEVRLGLLPAVIAPYVVAKIGVSGARRYFLTGELFDAMAAKDIGLVHAVATTEALPGLCDSWIANVLAAAPGAVGEAKALLRALPNLGAQEATAYTTQTIARVRVGDEAQAGLGAFFAKTPPPWALQEKT